MLPLTFGATGYAMWRRVDGLVKRLTPDQEIRRSERVSEAQRLERSGDYVYAILYWSDIAAADAALKASRPSTLANAKRIQSKHAVPPERITGISLPTIGWRRWWDTLAR